MPQRQKQTRKAKKKARHKRGDVRADGYRFHGYQKDRLASGRYVEREKWISPASWQKAKDYVESRRAEHRAYIKEHYKANREKYLQRSRDWYRDNPEQAKEARREWAAMNKATVKVIRRRHYAVNKEANRAQALEWKRKNKARLVEIHKHRMETDPQYRLACALRVRLGRALKRGQTKSAPTLELIGCSIAELIKHLESQFTPDMTWCNHGKYWHIDHIIPLAAFDLTDAEQQRKACHWSNLQPLTIFDNLSKGDRLPAEKKTRRPVARKKTASVAGRKREASR
jgi:hypothetical protein